MKGGRKMEMKTIIEEEDGKWKRRRERERERERERDKRKRGRRGKEESCLEVTWLMGGESVNPERKNESMN